MKTWKTHKKATSQSSVAAQQSMDGLSLPANQTAILSPNQQHNQYRLFLNGSEVVVYRTWLLLFTLLALQVVVNRNGSLSS